MLVGWIVKDWAGVDAFVVVLGGREVLGNVGVGALEEEAPDDGDDEEAVDDAEPVIAADDDQGPLPVIVVELAIELSVAVTLGQNTVDEISPELDDICVPELTVELEEIPVDVPLPTVAVDIDVELAEIRVDVSVVVAVLDCEFVGIDVTLAVTLDPEPEESVCVLLEDELLDDVTGPDPELVLAAPVEEIPDMDDSVLVVVKLPGTPDVELEVAAVVLEFDEVTELTVQPLVADVSLLIVVLPLIELWIMDIVVVMVGLFVSVLVTVIELENELFPTDVCELNVLLPLGLWPAWEVVGVAPVMLGLGALPVELLVKEVLVLLEFTDEPLPFDDIEVAKLDELLSVLLEAPVVIDTDVRVVALPEGIVSESVKNTVVVPGIVQPEVIFMSGGPPEGETPNPLTGVVLEPEDPGEVVVVTLPLAVKGVEVEAAVAEFVPEVTDDKEVFPEIIVCVVDKMIELVPRAGVVVLPEAVVTAVEPLDPVLVLLTIDPERELGGDTDPPEKLVDVMKLLLEGGGKVKPG
ncbi:hypothetical protein F4678DRAFT_464086 [Xylaria arbuscula]|nr:hypothetical protein F4678DRAFT_464086 [Xylaria arbuscula]